MTKRMTLAAALCLVAQAAIAQTATDLNCTSCVGETDIANQAVTGAKIANGTITATDIRLSTITSDRIKNQTLVMADLAPSLQDDIGGAIANLTVQRVSASATSVVGAACPSGRIPCLTCSSRIESRSSKSIRPSKSFTVWPSSFNRRCSAMRCSRVNCGSFTGHAARMGPSPRARLASWPAASANESEML